jgi:hypothetical protein
VILLVDGCWRLFGYFSEQGSLLLLEWHKRGNPVYIALGCTGFEEVSKHFKSYVRRLFLHFYKRLFSGLCCSSITGLKLE